MISIRRFKTGDEANIVKLSHIVFPNFSFEKSDFLWRHRFDKKNIFVAVDKSNNIVSHWAFIKKKITIGQLEYKAGLTMAAMTDPRYQGQGIFSDLASQLLKEVQKDDIDFLFGFPNDVSLGIHHRVGFVKIKDFHIYSHPLTNHSGNKAVQDAKLSEWAYPDNSILHVKKDSAYLEWRYATIPSKAYKFFSIISQGKIVGQMVVKKYHRNDGVHLQMVDLLCGKKGLAPSLLFNLLNTIGHKEKVNFISTWNQEIGCVEDKMLRKFGFTKDQSKAFHLVAKFISNKSENLIETPWDIKMGDTEIF